MAIYQGACRSNEFAVQDVDEFEAVMHEVGAYTERRGGARVRITDFDSTGFEAAGWPELDAATAASAADFPALVARHLQEREVAVLFEVGFEGWNVYGCAVAINAVGERRCIDLGDVDRLVAELTDSARRGPGQVGPDLDHGPGR
jgi:hypothetical protein